MELLKIYIMIFEDSRNMNCSLNIIYKTKNIRLFEIINIYMDMYLMEYVANC